MDDQLRRAEKSDDGLSFNKQSARSGNISLDFIEQIVSETNQLVREMCLETLIEEIKSLFLLSKEIKLIRVINNNAILHKSNFKNWLLEEDFEIEIVLTTRLSPANPMGPTAKPSCRLLINEEDYFYSTDEFYNHPEPRTRNRGLYSKLSDEFKILLDKSQKIINTLRLLDSKNYFKNNKNRMMDILQVDNKGRIKKSYV